MTIDEAIEILEHKVTYRDCFDNTSGYLALKLGIEALKRIKILRVAGYVELLLGETKE